MSGLGNFGPGPMLTPDLTQKIPATPEATEREDEYGRLLVALHTRLCGECPAFPGCGEACDPRTCDCCHDDGDPLEMLAAVAAVESERGRRAERERLAGIVEGMRVKVDVRDLDDGHESARLDSEFNAALDALLAKLREAK